MHKSKFVVLALLLLGAIAGVLVWQLGASRELTYPQAVAKLDSLLKRVSWSESVVIRKATMNVDKVTERHPAGHWQMLGIRHGTLHQAYRASILEVGRTRQAPAFMAPAIIRA